MKSSTYDSVVSAFFVFNGTKMGTIQASQTYIYLKNNDIINKAGGFSVHCALTVINDV